MILLDLFFPPTCMHCEASLAKHTPLCSNCLEQMQLLPEEGHCQKCFAQMGKAFGTCKSCQKLSHALYRLGCCFEAYGPARTYLQAFLVRRRFYLAKDLAAFIILQLNRLHFPDFDLITMVPKQLRNFQYAVGKEVSKMLKVPFHPVLGKEWSRTPTYSLKKRANIINKKVLLIDLFMHSRQTIRGAASALKKGLPESLYGITFCAD
jgi:predicted amidophosphoribosyltransferase